MQFCVYLSFTWLSKQFFLCKSLKPESVKTCVKTALFPMGNAAWGGGIKNTFVLPIAMASCSISWGPSFIFPSISYTMYIIHTYCLHICWFQFRSRLFWNSSNLLSLKYEHCATEIVMPSLFHTSLESLEFELYQLSLYYPCYCKIYILDT